MVATVLADGVVLFHSRIIIDQTLGLRTEQVERIVVAQADVMTGRRAEVDLGAITYIIDGRTCFSLMMGLLYRICAAGGITIVVAPQDVGSVVGIDSRQVGHDLV